MNEYISLLIGASFDGASIDSRTYLGSQELAVFGCEEGMISQVNSLPASSATLPLSLLIHVARC